MMRYKITELTPEILPDIVDLEKLCFSSPLSLSSASELYNGGIGNGFVCIETVSGEIAAYGGVVCAADEAQILNIATHPKHRRQGLAKAILEKIIVHAQNNGANFITLEVRESNAPAVSLYRGFGFYEAGVLKNYYKLPTENGLIMKKDMA